MIAAKRTSSYSPVQAASWFAVMLLSLTGTGQALAFDGSLPEPHFSKTYATCMEKSGGVTIEMRECTGAELKWQDGRLNRAYREYAASLSPHVRQRLKEAQRAWLQFREKECDWAGAPDEGYTLGPIIVGGCVLDMTARRADEFEAHLRTRY